MSAAIAYLSAIGGMLSYGVASVVQAHAALSATGIDIVKHPAYLTGIALDGLAWVLSLVALASLPLFAVQSMLAGSLAVTMILAAIVLKVPLARRDWWAIGMVTCGLLALGVAGAVLYARALEVGTVGTATAVLWVIEVVVPGLLGVVLLGDCVRPGFLALALGGVLAAIVGCVVLARSRTQEQIPE